MKIINEEKRYRELKERIRLMNIQRIGIEKINLIEDSKKKHKTKQKALMKLLDAIKLLIKSLKL